MKIRQGFVSNSSSSSFVIGVGKVRNKEKLLKHLKKDFGNDLNYWNTPVVFSTSDIIEAINGRESHCSFMLNEGMIDLEKSTITLECFNGIKKEIHFDFTKEEEFFFVEIANDEGDGAFQEDPDSYDLNYDIDLSFLPKKQQDLFLLDGLGLVEDLDLSFGAERNG